MIEYIQKGSKKNLLEPLSNNKSKEVNYYLFPVGTPNKYKMKLLNVIYNNHRV